MALVRSGIPVPASGVVIQSGPTLNAHNLRLAAALREDGRVWIATAVIDGAAYLRPCFVNFRSSDDDVLALIEITREIGEQLV